jgi:hypothetical protein
LKHPSIEGRQHQGVSVLGLPDQELVGWFGRQALEKFLGAIDFMAPGACGWAKNASNLLLTFVCPQTLISSLFDRFQPFLNG